MNKRKTLEYVARVLKENGMRPELADMRHNGVAIVITNVSFNELGYNRPDNNNPNQPKEVQNVPN